MDIVENILEREPDAPSRVLPYGAGDLHVEKVIACDVGFDTMDDVDEKTRNDRRFAKRGDYSIQGMLTTFKTVCNQIDILIHSVAFSPEVTNPAIDTSRKAYLTALNVSSYSLTALLRACLPLMENRPGGASAVGLTYLGGSRVVPHYGGGMSSAKAALADRRDAAGQQPGAEEHPRQPDLGRPLRLARPPPSARAITPSTR